MGNKRPHSDMSTGDDSRGRQAQAPDEMGTMKKKKQTGPKKHRAKEGTINWARRRARNIERRFNRKQDTLPATVQKDLEREMAAHSQRIQEYNEKKHRAFMIKKYHMVRFFERKKAQRLEKQLQRRLETATGPEEVAAIKSDLHIAQVDVNYAIYFPFMERYVSLYPIPSKSAPYVDEKSAAALALHSQRPPLWTTVEKAMEKGGSAALLRLQNRRLGVDSRSKAPAPAPSSSKHDLAGKARALLLAKQGGKQQPKPANDKKNAKKETGSKRKQQQESSSGSDSSDDDSESGSDGGFFEEG